MKIVRSVLMTGLLAATVLGARSSLAAEGWHCMMLNQTEQQAMDFSIHIPVYDAPSPTAHVVGYASAALVVADQAAVSGYLKMKFPNGKGVWIAETNVKPWHALANPTAQCSAYIKPNGKPGFQYH